MNKKQIVISDEIYKQLEQSLTDSGLDSVDEFAESLLKKALGREDEEPDYNEEDEEKIQKRLQDLGYID